MSNMLRLLVLAALTCGGTASPSCAGLFPLFSRNTCCTPCPPCPPRCNPGSPPHTPISHDASDESKPRRTPRVHALLIATTDDPSIGRAVRIDNDNMRDILMGGIPPAYRSEIRMVEGSAVTEARIFAEI